MGKNYGHDGRGFPSLAYRYIRCLNQANTSTITPTPLRSDERYLAFSRHSTRHQIRCIASQGLFGVNGTSSGVPLFMNKNLDIETRTFYYSVKLNKNNVIKLEASEMRKTK